MKNIITYLILLLSLAANGMCQDTATPPSSESTAAISQLRDGLVDSFTKGDIDRLLSHLDPDVVVTWQNGEVCRGVGEVRAFYTRMMSGDKRVVREVKSDPEIVGRHIYGDWAVSWGNLHDHFVLMDGTDLPLNSVFTATIAKRGDRWLVTSYHVSVNTFENPVIKHAVAKTAVWTGLAGCAAGLLLGWLIRRVCGRKQRAATRDAL